MCQMLNSFVSDIMVMPKTQALASLVASSGEVLEERLDRVRTYYDLLTIPFEVSDQHYISLFIVKEIDCKLQTGRLPLARS